jgi:hypothetical protein
MNKYKLTVSGGLFSVYDVVSALMDKAQLNPITTQAVVEEDAELLGNPTTGEAKLTVSLTAGEQLDPNTIADIKQYFPGIGFELEEKK